MKEAGTHGVRAGQSGAETVTLDDGTAMAVRVSGSGDPLLLVHGWAAHGGFFDGLADALSDSFSIIVPDLRGHGATGRGKGPLTMARLADDLHALLRVLDLRNAVAVGWSMGAMVLWSMIGRHGADRLAGLVTIDMSPRILNDADWTLGMQTGLDRTASAQIETAMRTGWPAYAAAFAPRMFARPENGQLPDILPWAVDQMAGNDADAMAELWGAMAETDCRDTLAGIRIPALVTYGALSQAYSPETSRHLAAAMPDARLKGFARSGHAPHLEEPDAFARAITDFAREVQTAPAQPEFTRGVRHD